jgi:hypothetical protein
MREGLSTLADEARAQAAVELSHPALYSVLVECGEGASAEPQRIQFGFQQLHRGRIRGDRLKTCWIETVLAPRSTRIVVVGTYGRDQFKALAGVTGMVFPPPALDLSALRLELDEVLTAIQRTSPFASPSGKLSLSVCLYSDHLAWRVLQEAVAGFRTVFLHAEDGRVLFEKIDWSEGRGGRPAAYSGS